MIYVVRALGSTGSPILASEGGIGGKFGPPVLPKAPTTPPLVTKAVPQDRCIRYTCFVRPVCSINQGYLENIRSKCFTFSGVEASPHDYLPLCPPMHVTQGCTKSKIIMWAIPMGLLRATFCRYLACPDDLGLSQWIS